MKCYKITEKTGNVIGAKAVNEENEIMMITTEGIIIRITCAGISILGRITSGVKLINLDEGVTVASLAKVREKAEGNTAAVRSRLRRLRKFLKKRIHRIQMMQNKGICEV